MNSVQPSAPARASRRSEHEEVNGPRRASQEAMYSEWWLSSDGTTRRLSASRYSIGPRTRTVDVELLLLHQTPQRLELLGGDDALHLQWRPTRRDSRGEAPTWTPECDCTEQRRRLKICKCEATPRRRAHEKRTAKGKVPAEHRPGSRGSREWGDNRPASRRKRDDARGFSHINPRVLASDVHPSRTSDTASRRSHLEEEGTCFDSKALEAAWAFTRACQISCVQR